ncbi:hypothetical protein ACIQNU_36855 [Streptomyces sp. NPDC091292]|uniref:hypothetical protein n=1 Tax=Streptomyces sp. NPDC091292 TaxID=3365991 RepID=UPI0037F96B56
MRQYVEAHIRADLDDLLALTGDPARYARWDLRHLPTADGVRLIARYGHRSSPPGRFGALADRLVVRPLAGWVTAWSFDRLRLRLERGISPERALVHWCLELALRVFVLVAYTTGLVIVPLAYLAGPLASLVVYGAVGTAPIAVALALFLPPLPGTPAARRCLRTPPDRARAPRLFAAFRTDELS